MGILRIKPASVEELIDKDPYDFFSLEEPHTAARRFRPEMWLAACVGVLASFAFAAFAFWHVTSNRTEVDDRMFAYCEIKVIDSEGRPVPGALVRDGDQSLGVTDSFGEWRRFVHVKPGMTLAFTITKKNSNGAVLSAVKNLAVPLSVPEGIELELSGSVQLGKPSAAMAALAKQKAAANAEAALALAASAPQSAPLPPPKMEFSATAPAEPVAGSTPDPESEKPELAATPEGTGESRAAVVASIAANKPLLGASAEPPAEIRFDAVWMLAEQSGDPRLADVLTYLKRRAIELGLRIVPDAPWRLTLRHLEAPAENEGASGLIEVEGSYQNGQRSERLFAYLRNYQDDMLQTARDILWSVTQHVRKAHRVHKQGENWTVLPPAARLWQLAPGRLLEDGAGKLHKVVLDPAGSGQLTLVPTAHAPCQGSSECDVTTLGVQRLPPVTGWQRMRLRVLGPMEPETDVFVSGYLTQKKSGNLFEYWGMPTGSVNVTVVGRGKLLHRERVTVGPKGEVSVSIPQAPISLR